MDKAVFAQEVLLKLTKRYGGNLHTELKHSNLTELFVAVFLSPQCNDKQVNKATPALFRRFRAFKDYANAAPRTLMRYLSSLNFYKTKARNLKKAAGMIVKRFSGKLPTTIEEFTELPGVGRKVANVILNEGFGINEGIAIDTHCITVSRRLRLTRHKTADKIERDIMGIYPEERWGAVSNLFIALGRDTCQARRKYCQRCALSRICPSSTLKRKH